MSMDAKLPKGGRYSHFVQAQLSKFLKLCGSQKGVGSSWQCRVSRFVHDAQECSLRVRTTVGCDALRG